MSILTPQTTFNPHLKSNLNPLSSHTSNGFDDMNCVIEPTEELGGIYVGNIKAARDPEFLRRNKIRAVLTVASRTGIVYPENLIHFHKIIEAEDVPQFELGQFWDQSLSS